MDQFLGINFNFKLLFFHSQPDVKYIQEDALHESQYKEDSGWQIECDTRILESINFYRHQQ